MFFTVEETQPDVLLRHFQPQEADRRNEGDAH